MRKLLLLALLCAPAMQAQVKIAEVYGGAGCTIANCSTYSNDYVVLVNTSLTTAVDLTGWSIQYASATGPSGSPPGSFQVTPLSGSIAPGRYFLVAEAAGNAGNFQNTIPTADVTGTISMSSLSGKVALVSSTTAISGTTCPASSAYIDFVGYGTANCFEGTGAAPTLTTTTSDQRTIVGPVVTDTDNNSTDFTAASPNPRNSSSAALPVELSMFMATANGASALLRWTTESETNNAGFTVEQQDGAAWRSVGSVTGRGTTLERSSYQFAVTGLEAGTYRFRLRQTDFDGTTSYSAAVEVVVGLEQPLLLAVAGRTVRFAVQQAQPVEAVLYNALGQRLATLFAGDVEGGQTHSVTVASDLPAGVYFVRVSGATVHQSTRLVVAR